jgi:ABC-2 type transport system permease protein
MSAVRATAMQALRLWWREGRLPGVLLLVVLLGALSATLSIQRAAESERDRIAAEATDRETFANQGARNPHSVAHFSRFAFRPLAPIAALDPGIGPYAGVAIWMEAHYQDPANLRAAEDRVELGRLADLSPAWLLQVLLPLLIIALAFDAFAGERERGTLPLLLGSGANARTLLLGKALALAVVFGAPLLLLATAQLPSAWARADAAGDVVARLVAWLAGHALYLGAWIALALAVSLRVSRTRTALVALLAAWTLATLIAPRLAIGVAETMAPVPTAGEFSAAIHRDLREGIDGHDPADARREAFKQQVLEEYGVERVEDLPVSFAGLALQEGERYGHIVFDRHFGALADAYRAQERWRRVGVLAGPLPALQQVSMAAAGTDIAHHVDFMAQAEARRRLIVGTLDQDLIRHGAGQDMAYMADEALWARIPEFDYALPAYATLAARQRLDWLLLVAWLLLATWLARRSAARMEAAR